MAIVLSNQENIDLLLVLVKLAIALGAIAIALWFLFWLRLKNLEKRLYFGRKQFFGRKQSASQFSVRDPQKTYAQKNQRTLVAKQIAHRPVTNVRTNAQTSHRQSLPITQVYRPTTYVRNLKNSSQPSAKSSWRWVLAIALASITGTAIAILQLANSLISPEFTTLVWFGIGIVIVISATLVEVK